MNYPAYRYPALSCGIYRPKHAKSKLFRSLFGIRRHPVASAKGYFVGYECAKGEGVSNQLAPSINKPEAAERLREVL